MAQLRAPGGCPWDREQDPHSLKPYIIEEAYEVCEAIEDGNPSGIRDELGDLLFQVVFQSQIASEQGHFTFDEVVNAISDKMERRHPHVFGDESVNSAEEVAQHWEQRKVKEKGRKGLLDGVPKSLPALRKARRVTEKAALIGFDWPSIDGALDKVNEEMLELKEARQSEDRDAIFHEFGDVLFALVNVGRFLDLDPEDALRETVARFMRRFEFVEGSIRSAGKTMQNATLDEMQAYWEEAKLKV
jgi:tetrapyrrole methylase family protein / MazG family protein